jgi:S-adenosylmethionine synthetase
LASTGGRRCSSIRGAFLVGGPRRDAGLTGRKNVVDTYGGFARQGGGALSGKDPAHVDRFGAYMARYMARNVVAAGLARRCEVQLSYGIGEVQPLAVSVQTFGTGQMGDAEIERAIERLVDLTPATIVETFDLRASGAARGRVLSHACRLRSLRPHGPGCPLGA